MRITREKLAGLELVVLYLKNQILVQLPRYKYGEIATTVTAGQSSLEIMFIMDFILPPSCSVYAMRFQIKFFVYN